MSVRMRKRANFLRVNCCLHTEDVVLEAFRMREKEIIARASLVWSLLHSPIKLGFHEGSG